MFSLTVRHYAGKSGYTYLREKFNKHLPALSTTKTWLANSDSNCKPGFMEQTLVSLETIVKSDRNQNKNTYVSVCFDEMAIRRKIQWVHDQKAFVGFVTHGKRPNEASAVANNAIFFLITFIENGHSLLLFFNKIIENSRKTRINFRSGFQSNEYRRYISFNCI